MGRYALTFGSVESPDTGQGGTLAVFSPTTTGHASTDATTTELEPAITRSCRWHSISVPQALADGAHHRLSVKIKVTHTSSGTLTGGTAANAFSIDYSTNNGGSWTNAVQRQNYTISQGPTTTEISLPTPHLVSVAQIQLRDTLDANATHPDLAGATATVSGIEVEIVTADGGTAGMM